MTGLRKTRGMTLIEIMVAATIFTVAMLVAFTLVNSAGELVRNDQQVGDSNDNSRLALEYLTSVIATAGAGAPQGLYVGPGGPGPFNAVFGNDNTGATGSDDLWIVVPTQLAFGQYCVDPGAESSLLGWTANSLTMASSTVINGVPIGSCATPFTTTAFNHVLVTNTKTAALVTINSVVSPVINLVESGVTDAPQTGGYKRGDLIYGANIYHFSIQPNPNNNNLPALVRADGTVNGGGVGVGPFSEVVGSQQILYDNIEDLQVAFIVDSTGLADPTQYVTRQPAGAATLPTWPATFVTGLRGVRVSVVAKSAKGMHDTSGKNASLTGAVVNMKPMTVENNIRAGAPDGFRRSLYSRRVELANMNTSNL